MLNCWDRNVRKCQDCGEGPAAEYEIKNKIQVLCSYCIDYLVEMEKRKQTEEKS